MTYGALMALGTSLLTLLMYFSGMHDTPAKMQAASWVGLLGSAGITVATLALAMREKRAQVPVETNWGYAPAVGVGVLTALVGAVLGGLFAYVYFAFLNPEAVEMILQGQIAAMESKGLSSDQIDRAEPMMRRWLSPALMTLIQTIMGFLWMVVITLIVAIFLRRPQTSAPAAT